VARQYIGKLGKIDQGLVSVNAYGVLEGITFPLLFEVFKPRSCLKPTEVYRAKPQLAIQMIRALKQWGFPYDQAARARAGAQRRLAHRGRCLIEGVQRGPVAL
jgi:SRSO17 transposase